ncbi:Imm8 family immunity protein [Kribbella sp. NPDC048928]|uniref:Imm8 family immunity protein n=1 Tax=Kribbella sp. NPDC048928 TaxID=3364111 RepID=UPI0037176BA1
MARRCRGRGRGGGDRGGPQVGHVGLDVAHPGQRRRRPVFLTGRVGPVDGPGEESFDLTVCTPSWLSRKIRESGPALGRHLVIVESLDIAEVERFVTRQPTSPAPHATG